MGRRTRLRLDGPVSADWLVTRALARHFGRICTSSHSACLLLRRAADFAAVRNTSNLIAGIHASLATMASRSPGQDVIPTSEAASKPARAQILKSIAPEALISFIDGRSYKTLKRHLTKHGFTPDTYRERFGLPAGYPMVSSAYASRRSDLAKEHKFGIRAGRGAKHRVK